jgi:hypothetical protein
MPLGSKALAERPGVVLNDFVGKINFGVTLASFPYVVVVTLLVAATRNT